MDELYGNQSAAVQVWGKGYRVTADTEEFQRYVPPSTSPIAPLEKKLETVPWGPLLAQLYPLSERELAAQRCILLDQSALMAVAFAHTEDRHRRPSLLMTSTTVNINWNDFVIGDIASKAISLCTRLAGAYAETIRENPQSIGQQLRANGFLPARLFDLANEYRDTELDWGNVLAAVKDWRGIVGVGTTKLVLLGANVVLGTKFEAERTRQSFDVDGYYDPKDREIKPLSSRLAPWEPGKIETPPVVSGPVSTGTSPELHAMVRSIETVAAALHRIADIGEKVTAIGEKVVYYLIDRRKR
ncbi:MAG TPA: hypothetical protein VGK48_22530 [Terriglobia bacterium]|jgi:hypothetical protein